MSEELKPCPFCGGEPGMVQQTKVNWAVMCHVCGAEGGWSNPSDAIALWNRRATPLQAVPALTEPVAWHIGNPDGTMNKLGAIYHHRQSAVDHFDSYGGDFNCSIVPLYADPPQTVRKTFVFDGVRNPDFVPLRIEFESGYPEDVAFGTQRQMDRLKKWLDKFFAMRAAPQPSQEPEKAPITEIPDGSIGMEGLQHNAFLRRYQD